ncbi:DUF6093 family protein [Streptomyces yangpuensis]|uniref:DUF6093 family protein n=1 Tax=Streptomyces yangpuensis TaxID=1648182 RepID=UPI0036591CF5
MIDLSSIGAWIEDLVMGDTVRISRASGPPVLNPTTGDLEPPPPQTIYEGIGAVLGSTNTPGIVAPVAGQPYPDDPKTAYRLLTPVSAPLADRDDTVHVLHAAKDPSLTGRSWRCTQPGLVATVIAVRVTWLDENNPRGATP